MIGPDRDLREHNDPVIPEHPAMAPIKVSGPIRVTVPAKARAIAPHSILRGHSIARPSPLIVLTDG